MIYRHIPVMLREAIEYLNIKKGGYYVDCTLGGAGYSQEILKKIGENGEVLAIDMDKLAIENAKKIISTKKIRNLKLINGNFKYLSKIVREKYKEDKIFNGIVFDLGLSSAQLEDRNRGFSFQLDAPLDMAFGFKHEWPRIKTRTDMNDTDYIVNNYSEEELKRIFIKYGEEKFSGKIARAIISSRKSAPVKTTKELVDIIIDAVPKRFQKGKIHVATKTFQALRIATNNELENLEKAMPQAVGLLKKGGRLVIITYHSLEDRLVKQFFKEESKECICPPKFPECRCGKVARVKVLPERGKKFILPSDIEVKRNPRARSAKLRVVEKII